SAGSRAGRCAAPRGRPRARPRGCPGRVRRGRAAARAGRAASAGTAAGAGGRRAARPAGGRTAPCRARPRRRGSAARATRARPRATSGSGRSGRPRTASPAHPRTASRAAARRLAERRQPLVDAVRLDRVDEPVATLVAERVRGALEERRLVDDPAEAGVAEVVAEARPHGGSLRCRVLRVAVVGAGKFSAMFLSAARTLEDARIVGVADLSEERARATLARVGWRDERTEVTADALSLIDGRRVDLVVEATGSPAAAAAHALKALEERCHVVMVTAEVDALLGPLLAARAREAGVSYSLAYGDQPALVWELVEWARTCGCEVVCAGKG